MRRLVDVFEAERLFVIDVREVLALGWIAGRDIPSLVNVFEAEEFLVTETFVLEGLGGCDMLCFGNDIKPDESFVVKVSEAGPVMPSCGNVCEAGEASVVKT